jgi:phosphonate transport system substrate-binding protein
MTTIPRLGLCLAALLAVGCDRPRFREATVTMAPPPSAQGPDVQPGEARALRFSVAAMESPRDTYSAYSRLFRRMGEKLGVPIEFVQRRTYREVNDMLVSGALDAALVCTGGYLDLRQRVPGGAPLIAVPVVGGTQTYQALIVVSAASSIHEIRDLAGKRFAYTDELSFSGRAWARRLLLDLGLDPDHFFASTIYTRSHDRSVAALVQGLVDGVAIHGVVYAHLLAADPGLEQKLRVINRSPPFGAMPVVASPHLSPATLARLREILLGLDDDPEGRAALEVIGVDRFDAAPPSLYDSAARVVEASR